MLRSEPRGVAFRHDLARMAIEEEVAPLRREELHRAPSLPRRSARGSVDHARLAHHAEAAGDAAAVLRSRPPRPRGRPRSAPTARRRRSTREPCASATALAGRARRAAGAAIARVLPDRRDRRGDRRARRRSSSAGPRATGSRGRGAALALRDPLVPGPDARGRADGEGLRGPPREAAGRTGARRPRTPCSATTAERAAGGEAIAWAGTDALARLGDTKRAIQARRVMGARSSTRAPGRWRKPRVRAGKRRSRGGGPRVHDAHRRRLTAPYDVARRQLDAGIAFVEEHGLELYGYYLLVVPGAAARSSRAAGRRPPRPPSYVLVIRTATRSRRRFRAVRARGRPRARAAIRARRRCSTRRGALRSDRRASRVSRRSRSRAHGGCRARGRPDRSPRRPDATLALAVERGDRCSPGELELWRRRAGMTSRAPTGQRSRSPSTFRATGRPPAALWRGLGCPTRRGSPGGGDEPSRFAARSTSSSALGAAPAAALVARRLRELGVRGLPRGPRRSTREQPGRSRRRASSRCSAS